MDGVLETSVGERRNEIGGKRNCQQPCSEHLYPDFDLFATWRVNSDPMAASLFCHTNCD